jgi:hypothetical protein
MMSYADYGSIKALNWSLLRELAVSPLQFAWRRENPQPETAAMVLGRATHTAVLEPDRFPLEYVVFTGARRAGKDWEAFDAANADKTILKADEYETCLRIRDAVRGNRDAMRLIETCAHEVSVEWERDGVKCKGRMDLVTPGVICDLKTTKQLDRFGATVARFLDHAQMAWYGGAFSAPQSIYIIAAQSVPPHDVVVYSLPQDVIDSGRAVVDRLFRLYQECTASGEWPGLGADGVRELVLPPWASGADTANVTLTIGGEDYAL